MLHTTSLIKDLYTVVQTNLLSSFGFSTTKTNHINIYPFLSHLDPHTHKKLAEGHKASYCLEDTKCDDGVDQFYFCRNRGDQGISINCHDNYDYTLDCQWVDVTDLKVSGRSYKLRVIANPAFKVGESDYSNNVALCDITDRRSYVIVNECIQGKLNLYFR